MYIHFKFRSRFMSIRGTCFVKYNLVFVQTKNRQTSVCIPLRVIVTDRIIMMMILLLTLTISCCCLPIWVKTASPTAPFLPGLAIFPVEINSQCVKTQGYIHSGPLGHESVVLFSFKLAHIFQVSKSVYWMKTSHAYQIQNSSLLPNKIILQSEWYLNTESSTYCPVA